jgi:hypothetical protein
VVASEGIYYRPGEYTPSGRKHAAGYQDVSGFFRLDPKTKAVRAVASVALCEHGQVEGAEFAQASIQIAAAMSSGEANEQLHTYLRELLEVGDDATAEDLLAGLEALVRSKNTVPEPTNPNPKAKPMTDDEKAAMAAQSKQISDLAASVTQLNSTVTSMAASQQVSQHNAAVEHELTVAASMGKVVPAGLKAKGADGKYISTAEMVKEVMAAIPQTVSTEFSSPGTVPTVASAAATEARDLQICASLGLKPEEFKKECPLKSGMPHGDLAKKLSTAA